MKKQGYIYLSVCAALLLAFAALTVCLLFVDVKAAGESGAEVGFATVNEAVFRALGQSEIALTLSKLGGLVTIGAVGAFGVLGLVQVIRRKGIFRADRELYVMAGCLVLLAVFYVFFEIFVVNCRPVLDEGELAASYPSSHTMLAVAVAGMGMAYLHGLPKKNALIYACIGVLNAAAVVTVICRLLGGVHWLTDIVGGLLLGAAVACAYRAVCAFWSKKKEQGI
ncbi:MAG: phosphatase PAP2 family protein [Clostridia bacterium]|nr:phosphatase PAP2 family protein [Clostridia bacterium]